VEAALKAIAELRRRQILALIRGRELSAGEIAMHFEVSGPAVSQHLTVLKEAGLVSERREGTRRFYRARPEGLAELRSYLESFWDTRLQALKREAEHEERERVDVCAEGICVARETVIDASPETVWRFLVDPEKAVRWMGLAASLDPQPGGDYRVEVIPGSVARGEFVEVDPPHRLVFTWGWEPGSGSTLPQGSTTVELELIPDGQGTLLRLTHRGLPDSESAESHTRGWDHYLARLAVVAAGGDPGVDPWTEEPRR
jgi:uncharacterized protein YndB with AHSA1/START domain/DNA-binding transcriptional ArsR family regulator